MALGAFTITWEHSASVPFLHLFFATPLCLMRLAAIVVAHTLWGRVRPTAAQALLCDARRAQHRYVGAVPYPYARAVVRCGYRAEPDWRRRSVWRTCR